MTKKKKKIRDRLLTDDKISTDVLYALWHIEKSNKFKKQKIQKRALFDKMLLKDFFFLLLLPPFLSFSLSHSLSPFFPSLYIIFHLWKKDCWSHSHRCHACWANIITEKKVAFLLKSEVGIQNPCSWIYLTFHFTPFTIHKVIFELIFFF